MVQTKMYIVAAYNMNKSTLLQPECVSIKHHLHHSKTQTLENENNFCGLSPTSSLTDACSETPFIAVGLERYMAL